MEAHAEMTTRSLNYKFAYLTMKQEILQALHVHFFNLVYFATIFFQLAT